MAKDGVVSASALDDAQKNYEMAVNKQNVSKAQVHGTEGEDRAGAGAGRARSGQSEAA